MNKKAKMSKLERILIIIAFSVPLFILGLIVNYILEYGIGFGPGIQDYAIIINDDCELRRNSAHMIYIQCDGITGEIEPKIAKFGWSDDYIIAKTNPVTKRKYPHNPENDYKEPDLEIDYWWIFDLQNKDLIGPIDSEELFNDMLNELNITYIEMFRPKKPIQIDNYEQIVIDFFIENNEGFVQDGYDLEIVQREYLVDGKMRVILNFKMYSMSEPNIFVAGIIVEPNGNAYFE